MPLSPFENNKIAHGDTNTATEIAALISQNKATLKELFEHLPQLESLYKFIKHPSSPAPPGGGEEDNKEFEILSYLRLFIIRQKEICQSDEEKKLLRLPLLFNLLRLLPILDSLPTPKYRDHCSDSIVVISSYHHGTRGHIMATNKLINYLSVKLPDHRLTWLILNKDQNDLSFIDSKIKPISYCTLNDLVLDTGNAELIQQADAVLQFPALYDGEATNILYHALNYLRTHEHPTFLTMLEYDLYGDMLGYKFMKQYPGAKLMGTGFQQNSLGIFIEPDLQVTASANLLAQLSEKVKEGWVPLSFDENAYLQDHVLFLGYRNNPQTYLDGRYKSNLLNSIDFIHVISWLNLFDESVKSKLIIDVITPIIPYELKRLDIQTLQANGIKEIIIIKNKSVIETRRLSETGKTLRILDLYPIDYPDMKLLMQCAHPFMLCTGDQSLSEVLSKSWQDGVEVGIPFYQVVVHKMLLMQQMHDSVKRSVGENSVLSRYMGYLAHQNTYHYSEEIAKMICSQEMKSELKAWQTYLRDNSNIYSKLYKCITRMMWGRFKISYSCGSGFLSSNFDTKIHLSKFNGLTMNFFKSNDKIIGDDVSALSEISEEKDQQPIITVDCSQLRLFDYK